MDCGGIRRYLEPYADDELGAGEVAGVEAHLAGCPACQERLDEHRRFRHLLRRQPREAASPELRDRVIRAVRVRAVRRAAAPWIGGAAAAAILLAVALGDIHWLTPWATPAAPPIVSELVGKHIAYSQIESPVEFVSVDSGAVSDWFRTRLGVGVTVPDYSPAGIRLLGGRITDAGGQRAAYLFYEKGRTLMSVFVVPGARLAPGRARAVAYRGAEYFAADLSGFHVVFWSEGGTVFGLISMLDTGALLECGDRLRAQRAGAPQA